MAYYSQIYLSIWGHLPTEAYVESAYKQGLSLEEFEMQERSKPAFKRTQTYRDELYSLQNTLAQALGYY